MKQQQATSGGGDTPLDWLFETPADLVCPITHDLFKDPVINALGQVYERAAIERHFRHTATDPLSNAALGSTRLIPVYPLKSRAFEFRQHVAQACVKHACTTRSCEVAVRFLRRAAELAAGLEEGVAVPGLSQEVIAFLHTHTTNAYDAAALKIFADSLRSSGYVDQASQLYLRLVEQGADRAQQAAALRQCLACLGHGGPPRTELDRDAALPLLAGFFLSQQSFGAPAMLDLLREAGVPQPLVLQLCEQLLTRLAEAEHSSQVDAKPQAGLQLHDLMAQYCRLRFVLLQQQLDAVEKRVMDGLPPPRKESKQPNGTHAAAPASHTHAKSKSGLVRSPPWLRKLLQRAVQRKGTLATGTFLLAAALPVGGAARLPHRLLQAGSALLLLHCKRA